MTARALLAWAVAAVFALPLVWMAGTSLKPAGEIVQASAALWPERPTFEHYAAIASGGMWRAAWNSLVVTAGATLLALAAGLPAAYALARLAFPRRLDALFLVFVLVVKMAPPIVLAVPMFQVLRTLGLLDTLPGLILAHQVYALPLAIWMLLGFVRDVPIEVEEAGRMDGARLPRLLADIVVPMMAPGLAATAILVAIAAWNEFLFAYLFLQSPANFTLPTVVAVRINEDETLWGQLAALGVVACLPVLLLVGAVHRALTRHAAGGIT